MISIIISSYQKHYFDSIIKNIEETCGIDFEIIGVDNPGTMGICEAYNNGAKKAKFENLLFIHEDIIFHTENWGKKFLKHLNLETTGVIGIAGSNYVPSVPTGWSLFDYKYNFTNYIQNNRDQSRREIKKIQGHKVKVFAIDGVFLGVKKIVYNKFLFNENVKGFHGYDLDFSLRVATKYNNYVISDIIIEHFSEGSPDKAWFDNNMQIRKSISNKFNDSFDENLETMMFHMFLKQYFFYYKCTVKNISISLKFLPSKISLRSKYFISKGYLFYFLKNK